MGSYLIIVLLMTIINGVRLVKRNQGIQKSHKNMKFSTKSIIKIVVGLFFVAMVGSFLSAGMTVLFSLTLIFAGLSPFVASPTALILTCMTSASSTFLYLLDGKINFILGAAGSVIILLFSVGTRVTIYRRLMKNGKESVIMLFIIILVGCAVPANVW